MVVEINIDSVTINGTVIPRPINMGRGEWMNWWKIAEEVQWSPIEEGCCVNECCNNLVAVKIARNRK